MVGLTRSEWEQRLILAYQDETCPHCGLSRFPCEVDDWGVVWVNCLADGKFYSVGFERPPAHFAPDPDLAADLPF